MYLLKELINELNCSENLFGAILQVLDQLQHFNLGPFLQQLISEEKMINFLKMMKSHN